MGATKGDTKVQSIVQCELGKLLLACSGLQRLRWRMASREGYGAEAANCGFCLTFSGILSGRTPDTITCSMRSGSLISSNHPFVIPRVHQGWR